MSFPTGLDGVVGDLAALCGRLEAERDQARAEVSRLVAERDALRAEVERLKRLVAIACTGCNKTLCECDLADDRDAAIARAEAAEARVRSLEDSERPAKLSAEFAHQTFLKGMHKGAAAERAAVVAWVRLTYGETMQETIDPQGLVEAITAGEHRKGES